MMKDSNAKNGFVVQAGILAAAGIICRLIGLIYRVPLANILTDEGNGYYSTAYNIYTIVLLLASYSIPSAKRHALYFPITTESKNYLLYTFPHRNGQNSPDSPFYHLCRGPISSCRYLL